jgi:hypothetical protein
LNKVSLASRCYNLEAFPGQVAYTQGGRQLDLNRQEDLTLHFRVSAFGRIDQCQLSECVFAEASETTQRSDAAQSDTLNFLCLERAYEAFHQTMSSHQSALALALGSESKGKDHPKSIAQIRRENADSRLSSTNVVSDASLVHPTSLYRLHPPEDADSSFSLACSWSTKAGAIEGQHYVRDVFVRHLPSEVACPVTLSAKHPSAISTDFCSGPAQVHYVVTLANRLVNEAVLFEFLIEEPESFLIVGPERFETTLDGGATVDVPLTAIIPCSGIFNLQMFRLTIKSGRTVSFTFPMQWMIIVNSL